MPCDTTLSSVKVRSPVEQHNAHVPRHQRADYEEVARQVEAAGAPPAPDFAGRVSHNRPGVERGGNGGPGGPVEVYEITFDKPVKVAPRREVPVEQRVNGGVVSERRGNWLGAGASCRP